MRARSQGLFMVLKQQYLTERSRRTAEASRSNFHTFFENMAWPIIQPNVEFEDNWHIHAVAEHLEAITLGQIQNLIISIPFRMLKSSLVSQAWPAWEWINRPELQYLTASYAKDLATRDAVTSRRIIESDAYQDAYGDSFAMTGDQNVKTRYENNKAGSRIVTSTDAGATGFGGNRVVWDDPINALEADNEIARNSAIEFYRGTIATRFNNPKKDAIVLVHQRLNTNDPTGYILREQPGRWVHLVLPMRYEREHAKLISLGTTRDPRTTEGELLHPDRLDETVVQALEVTLGSYHTEAQLQQRPSSRGGTIFLRKDWKFWTVLPPMEEIILSVDCSFKDLLTSDFVAVQAWGRNGKNKYLLRRVRERLGYAATVMAVRSMKALYPMAHAVLIEDKANGSAVIEAVKGDIAGVVAVNPLGGKVSRAYAIQPQQEAGDLWLPDPRIDPTIEVYLTEVSDFPGGTHDDETDATTQAINFMARDTVATQSRMYGGKR